MQTVYKVCIQLPVNVSAKLVKIYYLCSRFPKEKRSGFDSTKEKNKIFIDYTSASSLIELQQQPSCAGRELSA